MDRNLVIVGLGYVGLPLALSFSKVINTIGFDKDRSKIESLKSFIDPNGEVTLENFESAGEIKFTHNVDYINKADFIIVAVPTPVDSNNLPDLRMLENACNLIGENISPGTTIIFESTVYPGVTEEICVPLLEKSSGYNNDEDGFQVAYSPERINPGDKSRKLEDIVKVVSGQDKTTTDKVYDLYSKIITAGLYRAKNIRIAEASKVIENAQRDLNIAFMNELSVVFDKLGIDTLDVLEAAGTKWNFAPYRPGLVGGHCIGVDPYYLTFKSKSIGHNAKLMLTARKINESMPKVVADKTLELTACKNINRHPRVGVLGVTFKENCSDFRNSKVLDLIDELHSLDFDVIVHDPWADSVALKAQTNIALVPINEIKDVDVVIVAVAHNDFADLPTKFFYAISEELIVLDLKGIYSRASFVGTKITLWRL